MHGIRPDVDALTACLTTISVTSGFMGLRIIIYIQGLLRLVDFQPQLPAGTMISSMTGQLHEIENPRQAVSVSLR